MIKALKTLSLITFGGLLAGALMKWMDMDLAKFVLPAFMFILAFVLMPFFLFFRYDEKQMKKKQSNSDDYQDVGSGQDG